MEKCILKRDSLYEEVWNEPMRRLASKYGISDNGLKKICRRLDIPTPPMGHWVKIKSGYKVRRPSLPQLREDALDSWEIFSSPKDEKIESEIENFISSKLIIKNIVVPQKLNSPHPFVKSTKDALLKFEPDEYGVIKASDSGLDIRISPKSSQRALRILNAILKALAKLQFEVKIESREWGNNTFVIIQGEKVGFILEEIVRRKDRIHMRKEGDYSYHPRWDYFPTGQLRIRIQEYAPATFRKSWSDTKTKNLENQLVNFIEGLIRVSFALKQKRLEREEWQRKEDERRALWAEAERIRLEEEKKISDFEDQVQDWKKSQDMYDFIYAVKKQVIERDLPIDTIEKYNKWRLWALQQADRVNPISDKLPFEC